MIYDGRSVACLKLIIGNARVVLQVVQDTLSLALQIPEKPGWPLVSDANVVAFAGMAGASPQTCLGPDKNEKGR